MHDIDKIVRRCCAEIEEGLKRPKKDEPVATKTAEAHPVQFIGRVVDVPVDKEPGDAEDSGSCCTKCFSDEKAFTAILPDGFAAIAVHAQITENLPESHDSGGQGSLAELHRPYANPVVQTEEKIVEVQQMQTIERVVEVLQIQCQEFIWHVTAPQIQEVIRQVTIRTVVLEVDK